MRKDWARFIFFPGLLLILLFACGGGGGGSTPPPPPPPPPPTPLTVSSVNPTNNATGVPITTNVVFTFSASLDPTTVTASSVELLKNNILVPTTVTTAGAMVTLTPSVPLDYLSVYTMQVLTSVKNTTGTPLQAQFSSSFTTAPYVDTTLPTVVSVNPTNGSTNVPISTAVSVTFSEPVATNTVNATSCELLLGAVQMNANVSLDATGKVVTLTPSSPLAYASTYSVVITTVVTDLAHNALGAQFTSSFVTVNAPPPPPPPPLPPFTLDTKYLMDSVTTDEVGNVYVSGRTNTTPTNLFVAKFDAKGTLLVLNSNVGLASGFYPYGKIYVHGGNVYVPATLNIPNGVVIAKFNASTLSSLLNLSVPDGSRPAVVADDLGNLFVATWGTVYKTDLFMAPFKTSYTGGTAIAIAFNGLIVAGKTNTVVSVSLRDFDFNAKWNEVSVTSGYDARCVSSVTATSMFFVAGSTFDATVTNAPHFPFVRGYKYEPANIAYPVTLSWTTLLAGTDMTDATSTSDGSQYAICAGPDTITKVRPDGTLAWTIPLTRKSTGVVEQNGALVIADGTNALKLFDSLTGAQK